METMVNHSLVRPRSHLRRPATGLRSTAILATMRTMSCTLHSPERTPCLGRAARSGTRRTMLHSRAASKLSATSLSLEYRLFSLVHHKVTRVACGYRSAVGRSLILREFSVFTVARVHRRIELEAFRKARSLHTQIVISVSSIQYEPAITTVMSAQHS